MAAIARSRDSTGIAKAVSSKSGRGLPQQGIRPCDLRLTTTCTSHIFVLAHPHQIFRTISMPPGKTENISGGKPTNLGLLRPTVAQQTSRYDINCNCNDNIVSAECDLFSKCEKCDPKKRNVKWIMDSGASMAFTSNAEACRRCVIS